MLIAPPKDHNFCGACGKPMKCLETSISYNRKTGKPIQLVEWCCPYRQTDNHHDDVIPFRMEGE